MTRGMPFYRIYAVRFGSMVKACELVGYTPERDYRYCETRKRVRRLLYPEVARSVEAAIAGQGGDVVRDPCTDVLQVNGALRIAVVVGARACPAMHWQSALGRQARRAGMQRTSRSSRAWIPAMSTFATTTFCHVVRPTLDHSSSRSATPRAGALPHRHAGKSVSPRASVGPAVARECCRRLICWATQPDTGADQRGQNDATMKSAPSHDLVAFGATSFVGQILCRYLLEEFGAHSELKWAAAGRSKAKLEELRSSLGAQAATLPLVVADAADEASLRELCASTRVVVSTVGPYARYGEPLVKACAESGTDYCDLTGEVQWIRRMLQRYEATARTSGARIVHCCGFDSIPSDMGVHFLQRQAMKRLGAALHAGQDARQGDARRDLRRHRRQPDERRQGGGRGPGAAQGARRPRIHCARPGVRRRCGNPTSDRRSSIPTSAPGWRRS